MWQRRRRVLAIATALLWLVAIEVLPGLHLATHADDHTHASDGSIHRHANAGHAGAGLHEEAHEHDGTRHRHRRPYPVPPSLRGDEPAPAVHAHRPAKKPRRGAPTELAIDAALTGHAALGIAHHALATLDPPPPVLAPVSAPVATAWTHTLATTRVLARPTARPTARGPPIA